MIVERRGDGTSAYGVFMHEGVDLVGRDARAKEFGYEKQGLSGHLAASSDTFDLSRTFDFNSHE